MPSQLVDAQQIQGNILRPFGGRYQAFVALSFRNDHTAARRWLSAAARRVTGTDEVPGRGEARLAPGRSLLNIGLTATGLVLLHPETAGRLSAFGAFWHGPLGPRFDDNGRLTTAPTLLGDVGPSDPSQWVVGGLGRPVDALLTIAAGDEDTIKQAVLAEQTAAAALDVLFVQHCEVLRDERGRRIEHFGFTDGISQPGVKGFPDAEARPGAPEIAAGEFILGHIGERRPQSWAARPVPPTWMHDGSFQVFRRLRQDVRGWRQRLAEVAGENGDPATVAAHALGRHLDGRPLAAPGASRERENDFTYDEDRDGRRTPFYAHIRKVNPRDDVIFRDRGHKMLRRGVPFGTMYEPGIPERDADRGMIFNSYVAGIEDQFEFVQRQWANNPGFPSSALAKYGRVPATPIRVDGLDPVLGDSRTMAEKRLPTEVYDQIEEPAFGGFVATTGAVYAFAPSLRTLRRLAADESLAD